MTDIQRQRYMKVIESSDRLFAEAVKVIKQVKDEEELKKIVEYLDKSQNESTKLLEIEFAKTKDPMLQVIINNRRKYI